MCLELYAFFRGPLSRLKFAKLEVVLVIYTKREDVFVELSAVFLISDQSAITMQSLSTFSSKCSLSMALFLSRER